MPPATYSFGALPLDRHTRNELAVLGARAFYDDPFFIHLSAEPMLRQRGLALYMRSHVAALGGTTVATGARDRSGTLVGRASGRSRGRTRCRHWPRPRRWRAPCGR